VVPWGAGKAYLDSCREVKGSLARALVYPADERREVIARFALEAKVQPAVKDLFSQNETAKVSPPDTAPPAPRQIARRVGRIGRPT
jgi:hypothetical protein